MFIGTDERSLTGFPNTLLARDHVDEIIIRVMVNNHRTDEPPYYPYSATTEPPPSYDVAVIYGGSLLNTVAGFSNCQSQVSRDFFR